MKKDDFPLELFALIKSTGSFEWAEDFIFFISNITGDWQIWRISPDDLYPAQVTAVSGNIMNFKISPDGEAIAFLADSGKGEEHYELFTCHVTGRRIKKLGTEGRIEIADLAWSPDSKKLLYISIFDNKYNLNVINVSGENKRLTESPELKRDPRWAFDGNHVFYFSMTGKKEGHIKAVSLKDGKIFNITSDLNGVNSYPRPSPVNNLIAFISDGEGMKKIGITSSGGNDIEWLPGEGYEENFPEWSPDGKKLLYISNREGNMNLSVYNIKDKKVNTAGFSNGVVSFARWSPDGKGILFRYHSSLNPPDLFLLKGEKIKRLTKSAPVGIMEEKMVEPELVSYHSSDNKEIFAFLYVPEGEGPHPAVVWIHGGPAQQHFNGWNPFLQIILSVGIAVFAPNIRGSTGRGREFEQALYRDWGGIDLEDVISAGEYLKSLDYIKSDKIAVGGASYGGFMSMTALVKAPHLWVGGINAVGPVNLATFYENTSGWLKLLLIDKYGFKEPEDDPLFYNERSPVNFIENLSCPLLLIYSEHDARVPKKELDLLTDELDKYEKDYEVILFSDEGHASVNRNNELIRYRSMKRFLQKVLCEGYNE